MRRILIEVDDFGNPDECGKTTAISIIKDDCGEWYNLKVSCNGCHFDLVRIENHKTIESTISFIFEALDVMKGMTKNG